MKPTSPHILTGEDNRLTKSFIEDAILPALDVVQSAWVDARDQARAKKDKEGGKGALVMVGKRKQDKFFSNGIIYIYVCVIILSESAGFDYPSVVGDPTFIPSELFLFADDARTYLLAISRYI